MGTLPSVMLISLRRPKSFPGNRGKQLHFDGGKHYVNVPQNGTTVNKCESTAVWSQGGGGSGALVFTTYVHSSALTVTLYLHLWATFTCACVCVCVCVCATVCVCVCVLQECPLH